MDELNPEHAEPRQSELNEFFESLPKQTPQEPPTDLQIEPPQPMEASSVSWGAIATGLLLIGGGFILLVPAATTTRGATRSARLQWQERQAEIHRAVAAEAATAPVPEARN
jgi:hypothetical protein